MVAAGTSRGAGPSHDVHVFPMWPAPDRGAAPEFAVLAGLMKPRSRGSLRLQSGDPVEPPQIATAGLGVRRALGRLGERGRPGPPPATRPPPARIADTRSVLRARRTN